MHADTENPIAPCLNLAMEVYVTVDSPLELGDYFGTARRIIPITGGTFHGPLLRGTVLHGGADWQYTRQDRVAVLEARYTLQTDAGELITVVNRGFRHGKPGLASRLASGERVPPSEYYFMTAPLFETSAAGLQWLTRTIFVGQAQREVDCVRITVWQVGDDIRS